MSDFQNIDRPTGKNVGGVVRMLACPVDNLQTTNIRVVRGTGYVNVPILLKDGKQWIEFKHQPRSLKHKETTAGDLFKDEVRWNLGKDEPVKVDQLTRMRKQRWVVLILNQNNQWIILGTPKEPAVFEWTERDQGDGPTKYNGYKCMFSLTRNVAAPFYRVYATFYINDEGELVFDNTFDPSLSASVNSEGELVLTGPNAGLYEINEEGYLIYTG